MEKIYSDEDIIESLKHTKGNKTQAANLMGMSTANFFIRIKKSKKIQQVFYELQQKYKFTKEEIEEAMRNCNGSMLKMSKELRCSKSHIKKLIEKFELLEIWEDYAKKNPAITNYHEIELYDDEIKAVIPESHGLYSFIARQLGVSRDRVMTAIKNNPELQQMMDAENEDRLDKTEYALFEVIDNDHDVNAIKFHLESKGKKRGYDKNAQSQTAIQVNLTMPKDLKEEDL